MQPCLFLEQFYRLSHSSTAQFSCSIIYTYFRKKAEKLIASPCYYCSSSTKKKTKQKNQQRKTPKTLKGWS